MAQVAVIIPAHNYGIYIRQATQSVLNQTFRDLQLIVVDDGSTDDTREVLSNVRDKRLHYIYQHNQGLSAARNKGIVLTDSTYVAFLDADDYWLPHKLDSQISLLEQSEQIGLVYGGYHVVDATGTFVATRMPTEVKHDQFARLVLGNYVAGSASTSVVSRKGLVRAGLFDESLNAAEDWDMWLRLAKHYSFSMVKEPVACIRVHENNMTSDAHMLDISYQQVLAKVFDGPSLKPELKHLHRTAKAHAKIAAAIFASRRNDLRLSRQYSWQALVTNPFASRVYPVLFRALLGMKL